MDEIKDIVKNVIGNISQKTAYQPADVERTWKKFAGKAAGHSKINRLDGNNLIVHVDSSAWLYQLNLKRIMILKEIQKEFPSIKKIYLKIGKVK